MSWARKRMEACPNRAAHTEGPVAPTEWDEWAEQMDRTHDQERCPGCGLYVIWAPRGAGE